MAITTEAQRQPVVSTSKPDHEAALGLCSKAGRCFVAGSVGRGEYVGRYAVVQQAFLDSMGEIEPASKRRASALQTARKRHVRAGLASRGIPQPVDIRTSAVCATGHSGDSAAVAGLGIC